MCVSYIGDSEFKEVEDVEVLRRRLKEMEQRVSEMSMKEVKD